MVWARVKEAAKRGKQKWRVGDLLADERCSPAVLDFMRSTHIGRTAHRWRKIGTVRTKRRRRAADEVEEQSE